MALVTVQRSPTPSTHSSPSVSESGSGEEDRRSHPRSISESFLTVKGAALFLPRGNGPAANSAPRISQRRNKHTGDLQKHLQTMFTVLRPEDTIRLAVRLESAYPQVTRYMVVVSTNGRQDTEESVVLGVDFVSSDSCTVGLVLPLWSDTLIHLDGDGGFSVSTVNRVHVFKPVSVQAMWSALQSLHKASEVARCHNHYPGSLFLTWVSYYQSRVSSNQVCVNEWNAMQDVESHRANSPVLFTHLPTEGERTERLIKTRLREIMMQKDLENVTCKEIRTELERQMVCNLREFKEFIDNEMITILGQMDSPTEIFEHVFLGSEWNASNLDELQNSGVLYILNVTREIDNFFPGTFQYHNIRVYDEEATNLLEYWNETYKFITKAKKAGAKCLVHCKMGVSRSASTVIAYAMKEYGWDLDTAFDYVKDRRAVTKPNPAFMRQLEEYQGILLASKQRHNKLWRSHSDGELSDRPASACKASSLGRSDSHGGSASSSASLHHFLDVAVLQALGAAPAGSERLDSSGRAEVGSVGADPPRPLPLPRAAAVVPETGPGNSTSVSVAVPVALPHPAPSLHILPPTPELRRARRSPPSHLLIAAAAELPIAAAAELPIAAAAELPPLEPCLNPPERSGSEETSALTLGSADSDTLDQSLSDATGDERSPPGPASGPPLRPVVLLLTVNNKDDGNNNPSEPRTGRGEAEGSSSHSADSIDFFSAREKFLGLAQDGRPGTPCEQRTAAASSEENEDAVVREEEGYGGSEAGDDRTHHDNGVSVRHIVTEIEAIRHSHSSLPAASPLSLLPSPHTPELIPLEHPPEAEAPEAPQGPLTPPPHPQSPSMLPCDWPAGSVRRATEQLEQKLKQEMEMAACQRSPLHSPSAEHPPQPRAAQDEVTQGGVASAESKERGSQTDPLPDRPRRPDSSACGVSAALPSSPVATSAQQRHTHVTVEGATVHESDADQRPGSRGGCGPVCEAGRRLARGSQELEKIQQTLRELQAFLHVEAAGPPRWGRDPMDTESEPCEGPSPPPGPEGGQRRRERREGKSFREPMAWPRATALEARIRQAGLTPPSLMKRSASLAKLDCLELSANDLSDLDQRTHARSAASASPYSRDSFSACASHPDDTWKKQKVLGWLSHGGGGEAAESSSSPFLSSSSAGEREESDGSGAGAPARQPGRCHSSRRCRKGSGEKKQRAAVLYNTM